MPPEVPPSDDEDDISLTSTAASDQLEEYEVEAILAQRNIEGIEQYLVKWDGYPYERCNWEPEESFCNPVTLEEWGEKRAAISRGEQPEFDVEALEKQIRSIDLASFERKGRRRAKRFRLGLLSADDGRAGQAEEYEVDSLFDSIDGDEHDSSKDRERSAQGKKPKQPTSHPKATNPKTASIKRLANAPNQRQPNSSRSPAIGSRQKPSFSPASKKQLAKRTIPPPAVGISTRSPNDLSSRIQQQKVHNFDPTDPARVQVFKNLSSKRRYEKASQRERVPDIERLDLRKPGDWLTSDGGSDVSSRGGLWNRIHNSGSDSLFVEQDGPMPAMFEEPASIAAPQTSPREQRNPGRTSLDSQRRGSQDSSYQESPRAVERPPFRQRPSQGNERERVPGRKFGARGRYWDPGEVLVTIRFGADGQEIGNARLCNLDLSTRRQILDTKERNNIDIWFRDTCTKEQYALLCEKRGKQNIKYSNGWALGFPDNTLALDSFAAQLRERNQAALWYHPQSMSAAVLVAYATGTSSSWDFFDTDARFPENITLKIVARSSLPSMASLPPLPPVPSWPVSMKEQVNENIMQPEDTIMGEAPVEAVEAPVQAPVEGPMEEDPKLKKIMAEDATGNIARVFREQFEFTYNELAEVNTFDKHNRHARAFYLEFPDHAKIEYDLMVLFLRERDTLIYSSRNEDDWEKFSRTIDTGTILFHREFTDYEKMRGLKTLLRKQINVFNISLSKPITATSDRDHIERLFPHGGVILLTEDFMRHDPDNAILITAWFRDHISKKNPGSWKLYLRPDIQRWLLKMDEESDDDRMFAIWLNIRQLIPDYPVGHENFDRSSEEPHSLDGESDAEGTHHPLVSTAHMPGYGFRGENDHEGIPKGLTQEERDTDHLVECFAGWCWLHAPRFRRFIVLSWFKPQPRWREWHHINIMHTEDFIKEFKVRDPDERTPVSRSKSMGEQNSSKPGSGHETSSCPPISR